MKNPKIELLPAGSWPLHRLLVLTELTVSFSEGKRLAYLGAVSINGEKITEPYKEIEINHGDQITIKVGKNKEKVLVGDE